MLNEVWVCEECGEEYVENRSPEDNAAIDQLTCGCGGNLRLGSKCAHCGKGFLDGENGHWDLCNECIKKELTLENAIKFGSLCTSYIKLNDFILNLFDKDSKKIEQILIDYAKKEKDKLQDKINEYCLDQPDDFAYMILNCEGKE